MSNQDLVGPSKQIWNDLISKQIIFTAKHLPGILNEEADFESGNMKDSSKWMSNMEIWQKLCSNQDKPEINPFVSGCQNNSKNTYLG